MYSSIVRLGQDWKVSKKNSSSNVFLRRSQKRLFDQFDQFAQHNFLEWALLSFNWTGHSQFDSKLEMPQKPCFQLFIDSIFQKSNYLYHVLWLIWDSLSFYLTGQIKSQIPKNLTKFKKKVIYFTCGDLSSSIYLLASCRFWNGPTGQSAEKLTYTVRSNTHTAFFIRKCLFVATVATDSAVFVATLPVEKK